jgi:hypothetical protein
VTTIEILPATPQEMETALAEVMARTGKTCDEVYADPKLLAEWFAGIKCSALPEVSP